MYETCIFDLYGTLVDIHTDEKKEELWEKLALFYAFYGAFYTPGELREAYGRLTEELSAGKRGVRKDAHEAFPEIQIEDVFEALFRAKGVQADEPLVRLRDSFSASFPWTACGSMREQKRCSRLCGNMGRRYTFCQMPRRFLQSMRCRPWNSLPFLTAFLSRWSMVAKSRTWLFMTHFFLPAV